MCASFYSGLGVGKRPQDRIHEGFARLVRPRKAPLGRQLQELDNPQSHSLALSISDPYCKPHEKTKRSRVEMFYMQTTNLATWISDSWATEI